MDIINLFLSHYFPGFIESFILWRLMRTVLDTKNPKIYPTVTVVGMFFIILIKQILSHFPLLAPLIAPISIILIIYTFLCMCFFAKNSFVEKLTWWGIYTLGLIIPEVTTLLILNVVMKQRLDNVFDSLLCGVMLSVCKIMTLLFFEMLFRRRRTKLIIGISYFKELSVIIIFNLFLIVVMVFAFTNRELLINNSDYIIITFFAVVLLITTYTVVLIFRIEKKSNEELETQLKLQQIEMELKLNIDMVTITDNLRKLRHDMNNHIGLMKSFAKTGKYEELTEYIDQLWEDVDNANELVLTENKILSVLLNAKKSLAKEKNIHFTSVIATQEINMQNKDICSLLSNILDNAIEAAEKAGHKKFIDLKILKTEEGCIIECENSYGLKPMMNKGKFITRKENSLIHGIGTENIKDIVTKYNGEISFEFDEEVFNVHVLLPA